MFDAFGTNVGKKLDTLEAGGNEVYNKVNEIGKDLEMLSVQNQSDQTEVKEKLSEVSEVGKGNIDLIVTTIASAMLNLFLTV